jgi:hypothetical protein
VVPLLVALTAVPLLLLLVALFALRGRTSFPARLARGAGVVVAVALVGVVLQAGWALAARVSGRARWSVEPGEYAAAAPLAWWVLAGGRSVQAGFEATVRAVMGRRQHTMLDNWPWYYALMALQTALLGAVVAWRLRRAARFRDPIVLGVAVLVLANAWLGRTWPWWGT